MRLSRDRIISAGPRILACALSCLGAAQAQVRGVYPLGMSATNSGVTPEPGFTYSNQLLVYSRDRLRGPDGELLATGNNSVIMDLNTLAWVSTSDVLFGAKLSLTATLPVANNSLESDLTGKISGGEGFADSFYQPVILGWQEERADIKAAYGFLAPTGRFAAGAKDNVGSGYWTHTLSSGQTIYLTKDRATSLSAFEMYEFHTEQQGTRIHPGQTLDLDYSLTRTFQLGDRVRLQLGVAGYDQWQTTDKTGPGITAEQSKAHYRVNALGFASNLMLPVRRLSLGFKYFKEFSNRSTFEGHSVQISGSIKLW